MTFATAEDPAGICQDELLRWFKLYDRTADIVSIFEHLFTRTTDLAPQVAHFERFPIVGVTRLLPDFSVITNTSRGIVGEVARIALHDNSVDKLCAQIQKYAEAETLPGPSGRQVEVSGVDVMLFVDMDVGIAAARRIIHERLLNDGHPYAPPLPPIIIQVAQDAQSQKYNFQRLSAEGNGNIHDDDWPNASRLSVRFAEETLSVPPIYFVDGKAASPLVNDKAPAIYLAVLLWTQVFPELALGAGTSELRMTPAEIASELRDRYGRGKAADVNDALVLLRDAGLAARPGGAGHWRIRFRRLRLTNGQQLLDELAKRVCAARAKRQEIEQLTLRIDEG